MVVVDETSCAKLTLWEEHIGCLEANKSYYLENMLLRVYNNERYLATAKHDSSITQIEEVNVGHNIQAVEDAEISPSNIIIDDAKITAVDMLSSTEGCLQCGHTVLGTEEEPDYGECQKCGLMQSREECKPKLSALFTVKTTTGDQLSFYTYNEIVTSITEKAPHEVTKMAILKSRPFSLQHNKNNIIQSITH